MDTLQACPACTTQGVPDRLAHWTKHRETHDDGTKVSWWQCVAGHVTGLLYVNDSFTIEAEVVE